MTNSTPGSGRRHAPRRVRLDPSCLALLGWLGLRLPHGLGPDWTFLGSTVGLGREAEIWGAGRNGDALFHFRLTGPDPVDIRISGTFEDAWAHARAVADGRLVVHTRSGRRPGRPVLAVRPRGSPETVSAQAA